MPRSVPTHAVNKSASLSLDDYLARFPESWTKVVDTSAVLFCERGFHAVTMNDIANAVGLSKAGLYHHCPSKEQILADIVRLAMQALLRQLHAAQTLDASPVERLHQFVVSRMEVIARYQSFFTIIWQERPILDRGAFGGVAKSAEAYRSGVRGLIDAAKTNGELRAETDTHLLMLAIDGMTGWAHTWYRRGGSESPTRIGEQFWAFLTEGVAAPRARSSRSRSAG